MPFEAFLMRARPKSLVSTFHPRYPFAQDRGPAADRLVIPGAPRYGHEPELAHLIDLLLPDDGVFLDVGADAGYFTIYVASRPGFRGQVHAFEPVEASFAVLQELVTSLGCTQSVTGHRAAASDRIGSVTIEVAEQPGHAHVTDKPVQHGQTVPTLTLDSLRLERVDFLKVDVEGHESQVLRGAEALIAAHQPFVFLESWSSASQPERMFEPLQFLIDRGYRWFLPAWLQSDRSLRVGFGSDWEMEKVALLPFGLEDRMSFPGEQINVFACPKSRISQLGARWPGR